MVILAYSCHEGAQENLLREWVARGHSVYLIDGVYRWNKGRSEIPKGVRWGIPKRPDVLWVGITQDLPGALLLKMKKLRPRLPIVMTHHWYPSTKIIAGFLYRRTHHVCICEHERSCLREKWGLDSEVMYPPVDTDLFLPKGLQPESKLVMVVGNQIVSRQIMGWDKLVEIMEKTHELDSDIHFQILGDNPEINPSDFPNVSTRNLKHSDLPDHESNARCLIWPTTTSLVPSSMLSAMALGKTVIAFDLEPHREVVKNCQNGYLIACYNTTAYAQRILELTRTPEDPELGKYARQTVLESANFSRVADQYESLFKRVIA
jgi:glycosyltransferase involved in cell wall biosynthesis